MDPAHPVSQAATPSAALMNTGMKGVGLVDGITIEGIGHLV